MLKLPLTMRVAKRTSLNSIDNDNNDDDDDENNHDAGDDEDHHHHHHHQHHYHHHHHHHHHHHETEKRNSKLYTISSPRCELSPTRTLKWSERNRVQITRNTSDVYHVQHAVYHVVRRDSSAITFDRIKIAFILALFHWLKSVTDKQGEETGVVIETIR